MDVEAEDVEAEPASASATAPRACAGGRPNFEPWWPVTIASCVSASTPSVTRTRTRSDACGCRERRLVGRVEHDGSVLLCGAAEQRVVLVVPVHDELAPREPGAARERELARRRDVGADALVAEQAKQRDVRERLRAEETTRRLRTGWPPAARGPGRRIVSSQ